jgi:hypothetical protein
MVGWTGKVRQPIPGQPVLTTVDIIIEKEGAN